LAELLRTFSQELVERFRLIFADSRFFALTDSDSVHPDEIDMDVIVNDLEEVRGLARKTPFVAWGISMRNWGIWPDPGAPVAR